MKYVTSKSEIPEVDHFAIIEFSTIYIPGDERSRTCPGHGYPASNENIARYIAFDSRDEWESEVSSRTLRSTGDKFVAIVAKRAKINTNISVQIT